MSDVNALGAASSARMGINSAASKNVRDDFLFRFRAIDSGGKPSISAQRNALRVVTSAPEHIPIALGPRARNAISPVVWARRHARCFLRAVTRLRAAKRREVQAEQHGMADMFSQLACMQDWTVKRFPSGSFVAAGDVNGGGFADIISGRGNGKPQDRVIDGASGCLWPRLFAAGRSGRGGAIERSFIRRRESGCWWRLFCE